MIEKFSERIINFNNHFLSFFSKTYKKHIFTQLKSDDKLFSFHCLFFCFNFWGENLSFKKLLWKVEALKVLRLPHILFMCIYAELLRDMREKLIAKTIKITKIMKRKSFSCLTYKNIAIEFDW